MRITHSKSGKMDFLEDVPLPILGSDEDLPAIGDMPPAPKRYYIVRIIKVSQRAS